jgi:C-terminal processing protease CtpA/Prc
MRGTAGLAILGMFAFLNGMCARAAEPAPAAPNSALTDTLSFEFAGPKGGAAGWFVWKPPLARDTVVVHAGRASGRIDRDSLSGVEFSAFSRRLDVDFSGDTLELRGWLRTQNVEGFAGLWLREDAKGGGTVEFDNMEDRKLHGTTAWAEYRVSLPLDSKARTIVFGGLLAGTGTVWLDEIQLLVDGKPVAEAPRIVRTPPPAEMDHEFDSGSRATAADLAATPVENLALLGRVWGFLKYHHRDVAEGKRNWDYELFRAFQSVIQAKKDRAAARAAIVRWIDRVGLPAPCRKCAEAPRSPVLDPPIAWIRDEKLLGKELSSRLVRAHRDRSAEPEQYYVGWQGAKNPDFSNEAAYAASTYPDPGYRLLALFRFWNVIEYWFPYRDVMKEDWNSVLAEFIPRVVAAGDLDAYRLAMIDLVARVHDSHANAWNALDARPPRGGCRLPVTIRAVGDRFVVGAYADSARGAASGLRIGDMILSLDGAAVDSLARAWAHHYGASNEPTLRRDIGRWLTRGPCGACRVSFDRGQGRREITAVRDSSSAMNLRAGLTHDLPGPTFRKLADDVAYLKLSSVVADSAASYVKRAAGTRCLVIDIRNYPSEFVVFALGQHLVDRPTAFVRFTKGDAANPGAFVWTDSIFIEPAPPHYAGKIVILVDETTQSSAEYTSMAFRSVPGSLVVGSTTAGADGNVSQVPLPGGIRGMISGIGVFYPDGRPTQRVGIVPDLVVHPTVEGIRAGRDEVLEAALEAVLGRVVRFSPGP